LPDIFLILNETFYDILLVSEIQTDKEYMGNFYDKNNAIYGHAVVPNFGRGTNKSEYELLTSNSNYLL